MRYNEGMRDSSPAARLVTFLGSAAIVVFYGAFWVGLLRILFG